MLSKLINRIMKGKKGITGLETAIILIAFVTVAAVLAYTVLSAGLFSSERGKEAVYGGLESAQSTLTLKGSVIGEAATTDLDTVTFTLALAIAGPKVDMGSLVVNYLDVDEVVMGTTDFTFALSDGSTERGAADILEGDEQMVIVLDIATIAATTPPQAYDTFTVQIIPPTGASLTIQRTLPGGLTAVMNLN
ncbi:MAG: archaellin/type IV pilin N-terminal domain-containing protein [Dehalogenimonas sp.]|uniref:Archaellin/type IV pilin N-terminal domain-containing protein n=1 Tax=Candidatus Dehalogenimonas loeffleri TaxID=3127115 RepID=A0ABZ2J3P4_9CHLR|nr:archaellin/type IV pilin N-terminal domain-containing protein [Dehalogenimonas sp.]